LDGPEHGGGRKRGQKFDGPGRNDIRRMNLSGSKDGRKYPSHDERKSFKKENECSTPDRGKDKHCDRALGPKNKKRSAGCKMLVGREKTRKEKELRAEKVFPNPAGIAVTIFPKR